MQIKPSEVRQYEHKYILCIPQSWSDEELHLDWYKLPDDVYESKEYPICKCGQRFVPINEGATECFSCLFREAKPAQKITEEVTKCSKCGDILPQITYRLKKGVCYKCKQERIRAYYRERNMVRKSKWMNLKNR